MDVIVYYTIIRDVRFSFYRFVDLDYNIAINCSTFRRQSSFSKINDGNNELKNTYVFFSFRMGDFQDFGRAKYPRLL